MITSLRNCPLSRHCRSSIVTVIPPFNGGGGNWINLSRGGKRNDLNLIICRCRWTVIVKILRRSGIGPNIIYSCFNRANIKLMSHLSVAK